jgi:hypothetical protein
MSNYYLTSWFGEAKLRPLGVWLCSALIGIMFIAAVFRGLFP